MGNNMGNNMGNKLTLRQYFEYNKNISNGDIEQIYYNLDSLMKHIHEMGYYVSKLDSDSIILESDKKSLSYDNPLFTFLNIDKNYNFENSNIINNISDLSKLAVGTFISIETGFSDYSKLDNRYINDNFDEISSFVPNPEYFKNAIVTKDNNIPMYYNDYVNQKNSRGKDNFRQMTKTNPYGKMYVADEESAFVKIVFYPVLIIIIVMAIAIFSKFF